MGAGWPKVPDALDGQPNACGDMRAIQALRDRALPTPRLFIPAVLRTYRKKANGRG
jgi:hypothetical protein